MNNVPDTISSPQPQERAQKKTKQPVNKSLYHELLGKDLAQRSLGVSDSLDPIHVLDRLKGDTPQSQTGTSLETISQTQKRTSSFPVLQSNPSKLKRNQLDGHTYTLDHFTALMALSILIEKYGRISHMGIMDPSYAFFMNKDRTAALYYKVKSQVAVVGGDPLCERKKWPELLAEFTHYRRKRVLGIAYLGVTEAFVEYTKTQKGWLSMRFGTERALDPMTNKVLLEQSKKNILGKNKQLLDPKRGGLTVDIYVPSQKINAVLQAQLSQVYEEWRESRNESGKTQTYMTIFDPFALPHLMIYVYTYGPDGVPNGFAALRRIDACNGFHIDPYCATVNAPKGTTDLLIYSSLALLNRAGVPYLGLGFEPSDEVSEIHGIGKSRARFLESAYRKTFSHLPIGGKKMFHDKWAPEPAYDAGLYIVYEQGFPDIHHSLATMHLANISARDIVKAELRHHFHKSQPNSENDEKSEKASPRSKSLSPRR